MIKSTVVSLLLLWTLGMASPAQALEMRATVDRTRIALHEAVNLTLVVTGGEGRPDLSAIRDFKVASRGTSTRVQIVNNRVTREIVYSYRLTPVKTGRLKIPALMVTVNGQTSRAREIAIQVSTSAPAADEARDISVSAKVSTASAYQGQQIAYTFRLQHAVQIANAQFQPPAFKGFNAKAVEPNRSYQTVVGGREFGVIEVVYILVPMESGPMTIEPAMLNCDLVRRRNKSLGSGFDSLFNDSFFGGTTLEPRSLRTSPLTVDVKPLPDNQDSIGFSGLVGRFDLKAKLDADTIRVGDSATLTVTVSGSGNIMDAAAPDVEVPAGFKLYTDDPEEKIVLDARGYSGSKVFRQALVAVAAGKYRIGPIAFRYFNSQKGVYTTLSSGTFDVTVEPSTEGEQAVVFNAAEPQASVGSRKLKVEFTGRDILPLKEELDAIQNRRRLSLGLFLGLLMVPLILYAAGKMVRAATRKNDTPRAVMAKRAEQALKQAGRTELATDEFYACLYRALVSSVYAKAGILGESLTDAELNDILCKSGFSEADADAARNLLQHIETARYGGVRAGSEQNVKLLQDTRQMIRRLI